MELQINRNKISPVSPICIREYIFAIKLSKICAIALFTASKEHADLERKYQQLQKQNSTLQSQVQEKEQKLQKLRTGDYLPTLQNFLKPRHFCLTSF